MSLPHLVGARGGALRLPHPTTRIESYVRFADTLQIIEEGEGLLPTPPGAPRRRPEHREPPEGPAQDVEPSYG